MQLSEMDWKYQTSPPPDRAYCQAMIGDRCNWPRGKVSCFSTQYKFNQILISVSEQIHFNFSGFGWFIGEFSFFPFNFQSISNYFDYISITLQVLNAMVYVRGNKRDYDSWAQQGNPGWDYENVLKYFKKSEDNRNPFLSNNSYHGSGGYLTVQEAPWRTPLSLAFIKAGMEMGYENRDINGESQTGFMLTQSTIRRGSRCSTSKAFLRPVRLRQNLDIIMHSQVTKVLFNKGRRAHGVEFVRDGKFHTVYARKEVILSAGSINSPQLLMLSGIGPLDQMIAHNISQIVELPVGHNLQDHVGLGGLTFIIDEPVTFTRRRFTTVAVGMEYIMNERGPMTTSKCKL